MKTGRWAVGGGLWAPITPIIGGPVELPADKDGGVDLPARGAKGAGTKESLRHRR
jgi:hypothetical protein